MLARSARKPPPSRTVRGVWTTPPKRKTVVPDCLSVFGVSYVTVRSFRPWGAERRVRSTTVPPPDSCIRRTAHSKQQSLSHKVRTVLGNHSCPDLETHKTVVLGSDRPLLRSPDAVFTVAAADSFADPKPPRRTAGGSSRLGRGGGSASLSRIRLGFVRSGVAAIGLPPQSSVSGSVFANSF